MGQGNKFPTQKAHALLGTLRGSCDKKMRLLQPLRLEPMCLNRAGVKILSQMLLSMHSRHFQNWEVTGAPAPWALPVLAGAIACDIMLHGIIPLRDVMALLPQPPQALGTPLCSVVLSLHAASVFRFRQTMSCDAQKLHSGWECHNPSSGKQGREKNGFGSGESPLLWLSHSLNLHSKKGLHAPDKAG